jgi:glycosyltransferase involved in cell wall biosynthesis
MKVLHLVHAFQTGGAERVVLNLTRYGSPDVQNVVCSLTEPHDLVSQLDRSKVGFHCLRKIEGNDPTLPRKLAGIFDAEGVDIVHSQGWGTYLEGLLAAKWFARRRPAFIFAFHGKSLQEVEQGVPMRQRVSQRLASVFTDACVAPAAHMADDYARNIWLRRSHIEVIYNGVDTDAFRRTSISRSSLGLGLRDDDLVVGFVGRLDPVKDLDGIVTAFAGLRQQLPGRSVRLLMIGEGPELTALRKKISSLQLGDAVILAGLRADIARCMSAMDVYFQPSRYEGHSVTLLEAMSAGLPVVSTRVGGTPEIVADGRTGFLHTPGDYTAMSATLARLLGDAALRESIGRAARAHIVETYSVGAMVGNYERLYRKVLGIAERPCAA